MVLPNKSMADISRCILESADKTNVSRFFSEAPWLQEQVNERRVSSMLEQTKGVRGPEAASALLLDDTLCEQGPGGAPSLFEYVDRHYNHGEHT